MAIGISSRDCAFWPHQAAPVANDSELKSSPAERTVRERSNVTMVHGANIAEFVLGPCRLFVFIYILIIVGVGAICFGIIHKFIRDVKG